MKLPPLKGLAKAYAKSFGWNTSSGTRTYYVNGSTSLKELHVDNNYEAYARELYKANSVVFSVFQTLSRPFSELRLSYQNLGTPGGKDRRPGELWGDQTLSIFEKPWATATTADLNQQMLLDWVICGNAYAIRDKDKIRVLRPDWVVVLLTQEADKSVRSEPKAYLYYPGGIGQGKNYVMYRPEQIAHFKPIPDPVNRWMGMSPLTPIVEEILADKAATEHKKNFFNNAATPSLLITLRDNVTAAQFEELNEQLASQMGSENAYTPLVMGGGADVRPMSSTLKEMDFKATMGQGETRIAAAMGVHPILAGLSEGMQGSALGSNNQKVVRDHFIDGVLRPMWAAYVSALENLVDSNAMNRHGPSRLWYDDRDVAYLRTDRSELVSILKDESEILSRLVREGWVDDSIVDALKKSGGIGEWKLLKHSGYVSVQQQPPGQDELEDMRAAQTSKVQADTIIALSARYELDSIIAAMDGDDWSKLVEKAEPEPTEQDDSEPVIEPEPSKEATDNGPSD